MGRYSLLQQQRKFLSTLSMRRATCGYNIDSGHVQFLSTLSMRRATTREKEILMDMIFLSTLSMRRATYSAKTAYSQAHISIHALHAESDKNGKGNSNMQMHFYPRSPCGERLLEIIVFQHHGKFLSTLSMRRATWKMLPYPAYSNISIHALHAESDCKRLQKMFNLLFVMS